MGVKRVVAELSASLNIQCPECEHEFDLFSDDSEGIYLDPIFNNKWDNLRGESAECPKCHYEFEIECVEW